ncbi:MAG TPA: HIT domain-containing protein [Pyrinomonadaceae bacterium]|nr:HIT domain-containing protein [Pyrinomonadaceae bacterium]
MDRLWTPWRYQYISGESGENTSDRDASSDASCIFCTLRQADPAQDERNFIIHRARYNFIVLNLYPYTSGHLLVIPYEHTSELDAAAKETTDELMDLTKRAQTVLRAAYRPEGFNLGMNLGSAAGAGVAGHIHLHIMPRWAGDANFMSTVGETRVLPEDLPTTYKRLHGQF